MHYEIERFSTEKDKKQILISRKELQSELGIRHSYENYKWMYEDNPAGKAISFMAKDNESSEYFGRITAFPRIVTVRGVHLLAAIAGEFIVKKKYRFLGPAVQLVNDLISIVQDNEFDLIYGFPNEKAGPVMKRAGFESLGSYVKMVRIMKTSRYLHKIFLLGYLSALLSPLLDMVLRVTAIETWYRFKGEYKCEEINSFDGRFDALWLKTTSRFQIVGERTSEYLRWKFLKKPRANHRIFAIFDSNRTELKGYIIYCMDENSVNIKDLILPEGKKAIRVFITHFLRYVRKVFPESIILRCLENKEITNLFKRFGFIRAKNDRNVCYYCNEHVSRRLPFLRDSENWLLFAGDDHA